MTAIICGAATSVSVSSNGRFEMNRLEPETDACLLGAVQAIEDGSHRRGRRQALALLGGASHREVRGSESDDLEAAYPVLVPRAFWPGWPKPRRAAFVWVGMLVVRAGVAAVLAAAARLY